MIGGANVPYGSLWRTGANEPTIIRTPVPLSIAGVEVPAGTYSLYSIPNKDSWDIIVNRSYSQWGHERQYTAEVAAQEVGRGAAMTEGMSDHVETFTVLARDGYIVFEWETTRVLIPVMPTSRSTWRSPPKKSGPARIARAGPPSMGRESIVGQFATRSLHR